MIMRFASLMLCLSLAIGAIGQGGDRKAVASGTNARSQAPKAVLDPLDGLWRLHPPFPADEPYLLIDRNGSVIGGGTLRSEAAIDLSALPKGNYVLRFSRRDLVVPIHKD